MISAFRWHTCCQYLDSNLPVLNLLQAVGSLGGSQWSHPLEVLNCKLFNTRSINNKLNDLLHVLSEESPDHSVCLTESWLRPTTSNSLILSGNLCNYTIFRKDCIDMQGGGVCIVIKNATVKAVRIDIDINFNEFDLICIDILFTNQNNCGL